MSDRRWVQGICLLVLVVAGPAKAQTASYYWNFQSLTASAGVGDPSLVPVPTMSIGNSHGTIVVANPNSTSASSGYTVPAAANPPGGAAIPASGSSNYGQAVNNATFNEATSPYYQFTLSNITMLQRIDFGQRSTGTGAASYSVRYSTDGFATPGTVLADNSSVPRNSSWNYYTNDFSDVAFDPSQTVTIRVYEFAGTNAANLGVINTRIDDFAVSFTPVPEPTTVLGLAAGGLGLLRLRRRLV